MVAMVKAHLPCLIYVVAFQLAWAVVLTYLATRLAIRVELSPSHSQATRCRFIRTRKLEPSSDQSQWMSTANFTSVFVNPPYLHSQPIPVPWHSLAGPCPPHFQFKWLSHVAIRSVSTSKHACLQVHTDCGDGGTEEIEQSNHSLLE